MSDAVRHNAANEHDSSSLRSTIEWLRAEGHLLETEKEVDPDLKLTGLQKHLDGGSPIRLVKARMVDAWALADAIGEAAAWQIRPTPKWALSPVICRPWRSRPRRRPSARRRRCWASTTTTSSPSCWD